MILYFTYYTSYRHTYSSSQRHFMNSRIVTNLMHQRHDINLSMSLGTTVEFGQLSCWGRKPWRWHWRMAVPTASSKVPQGMFSFVRNETFWGYFGEDSSHQHEITLTFGLCRFLAWKISSHSNWHFSKWLFHYFKQPVEYLVCKWYNLYCISDIELNTPPKFN